MPDTPQPTEPTAAEDYFVTSLKALLSDRLTMTQQELANEMAERGHKFHQATIYKILNGSRRVTLSEAIDIAHICGTTIEEMVMPTSEAGRELTLAVHAARELEREAYQLSLREIEVSKRVVRAREAFENESPDSRGVVPAGILEDARAYSSRIVDF
ncbi:hypothetical protein GCM10023221_04430 [Luteimicrobium xylanilyticum]|uniref:HTH cro/C1-type domain-containing protein n=1 Tax=Luteimicrobium xylanilyticum TaxID=1133546 RepID=A0A5P9Q764_9MICO|nr:helix-turn-helix transcriptional regulator [Luteimicrobium xylanilyticum]QFU97264.1 hypothetical protein KDY119_00758 [Luteimicrobium xylanilyticum]